MRSFCFLLLSTLLLTACASRTPITPPDVSLVDIEFGDITVFQTTLRVTTKVRNESPQSVNFSGSLHRLALNGIPVGKAVSEQDFRLAPLESKEVVSDLELSHFNLVSRIQEIIESPNLQYDLKSEFYTSDGVFGGETIKSERQGTLIR